jgi:DNA-binding SARP family transcriptional activator
VRISVLGPLEARRSDGGAELPLGGLRQRAVLARLAVAGGDTVPVDRMVDDLWDGEPPPSAVNTLQSYVSNLRRELRTGDDLIVERSGPGYRLSSSVELVSQDFERLVAAASDAPLGERVRILDEALGLWRGPALVELADQAWAEAEAARLDELRLSAMEARHQALLDTGQHQLVVGDLERAVAEHPLREGLTAQLVLALYRSGRQADALRAYERTRALLADELGLDPMPELVALADRVLVQDPDLAAPPAAAATGAPAPAPVSTGAPLAIEAPLPRPAAVGLEHGLLGRDAELAGLDRALDGLRNGDTRVVIVEGEAGVGKTTLVSAAVTRVHEAGGLVLWGRCAAEHLVAYQPVLDAVRAFERSLDPQAAAVLGDRHPVLAHLLGRSDAQITERDPYELYESVAALLRDLAAVRPLVLVVDDLHWADRSSLALLGHLVTPGRVPGLGLVGTVRRPAGRPTVDLDRTIADLRRAGSTDVVDLAGIDAPSVAALLDRCGRPVEAAVADAVHARTGGNPLFVEALSGQADDLTATDPRQLPHTVRETLDLRAAALDADDLHVLVTAAAIGDPVDLHVLADVCDCGMDRVLDVVDIGVGAGLLVEDPEVVGRVSFSHALARDALIARSTRNREAQLHLRIADVLAARPEPVPDAVLAQHLRAAGALCPPGRAAGAAIAAAREALEVLAPDEARTWARRALAQLDAAAPPVDGADDLRWDATSILSRTSRHLGDADGARSGIDDLLELARRSGRPAKLARAAEEAVLGMANVGFAFGAVDEGMVTLLDDVLAAIEAAPGDHPAEEATVLAWSAVVRSGAPPDQRQRDLAAAAAKAADRCRDRPHVRALSALAQRFAIPGPAAVEERLALHDEMLAAAAAARWTEMEVLAHVLGATDLLEAGRVEEWRAMLEVLRGRLAPHPRPGFDTYLTFLDAAAALLAGDLQRADELSVLGLEQGQLAHGPNATQAWAAEQFVLAWERGELPALLPMTEAMVEEFPDIAPWRAGHAAALVAAGDPGAARDVVAPLLDGDRLTVPEDLLWSTTVAMLAEVAWATGDGALGRAVADGLAPVEDRVAVTGMGALSLGHLVRHRGLALAATGDLEEADAALHRAVGRADAAGFRTWAARARIERAEVLDRSGRDGSALRAEGEARAAGLGIAPRLAPLR